MALTRRAQGALGAATVVLVGVARVATSTRLTPGVHHADNYSLPRVISVREAAGTVRSDTTTSQQGALGIHAWSGRRQGAGHWGKRFRRRPRPRSRALVLPGTRGPSSEIPVEYAARCSGFSHWW